MDEAKVHFEVYARRPGAGGDTLEFATEDRARALEAADELISAGRESVRVSKEILDPETRAFKSVTILRKGSAPARPAKAATEDAGPLCVAPEDLYSIHGREVIGRLLENWLARRRVTTFELMHRPDLVERLEAGGVELQHALQKVAVPEAQSRGVGVHEVLRHFQQLVERASAKLRETARRRRFPELERETFADACSRLNEEGDRHYLLAGAVAERLKSADGWGAKVERLLDLADAAPGEPQAWALALQVLEKPLCEILGSRLGLAELLGASLDLGTSLAALTRLAACDAVDAVLAADKSSRDLVPALEGPAARLAVWLDGEHWEGLRSAIGRRIIAELRRRRRLRPGDPRGEIRMLRTLAMMLTAASGRLLPIEEVREAFTERSRMLVAGDFVQSLAEEAGSALEEARTLVWLTENVVGPLNTRAAAGWLLASVTALKFESEARAKGEAVGARLAGLADLQRAIRAIPGEDEVCLRAAAKVGEVAGLVEADSGLVAALARAEAPLLQRVGLLLGLATGEAGPLGPCADRAKAELVKLLRKDDARQALAAAPKVLDEVRRSLRETTAPAVSEPSATRAGVG